MVERVRPAGCGRCFIMIFNGNNMKEEIKMVRHSADYDGFSLVNGGLIYSATASLRGKSGSGKGLVRTAMALMLLTWVPLSILAVLAGTLIDDNTTISFFEDFQVHVRLLFVVPFLILVENVVNRSFVGYIKNSDRIIPISQQESFNRLVKQLDKLTNSYIPEILVLLVIYSFIIFNWDTLSIFESGRNYLAYKGTDSLTGAGWFYLLICSPIYQLLIFRWIWRWMVWMYSVIKVSRFKLQVDPLHADQMAGLSFMNLSPLTFSFVLIALSAVISAFIGIEIVFHNAVLKTYIYTIAIYLVFLPIVLYTPLLVLIPVLIRAKTYGILNFGNLIREHNTDYATKWIEGNHPKDEQLLGTMDNSSLSDINGSYGPVQSMKLIPIDMKMLVLSFALNLLPFIPLVFTYYSASELFKQLINSVLAG